MARALALLCACTAWTPGRPAGLHLPSTELPEERGWDRAVLCPPHGKGRRITKLPKQKGWQLGIFLLGERGYRTPELLESPGMDLPPPPRTSRLTLAVSETVFQFPPLRVNLPLPIRVRISSGVSLGPLANGVYLEESPHSWVQPLPWRWEAAPPAQTARSKVERP